jgi:phosphoribosyl-AMP cyclohydrolase
MNVIETIKFDDNGLVPAIVQDFQSKAVLMLAYMNREAIEKTLNSGKMHYWSRSRKKLWLKGETSGHFQIVREVRINCYNDSILFLVDQETAACHAGYFTCFYRRLEDKDFVVVERKLFDEAKVYSQESAPPKTV